MTMRVEKVGVRFFQVFLAARASGRQRTFALRASKQQNVRKMLFVIWQNPSRFEGLGVLQGYYQTERKSQKR